MDEDVPAGCSAEVTGIPEGKHDRGDKSTAPDTPTKARHDDVSGVRPFPSR